MLNAKALLTKISAIFDAPFVIDKCTITYGSIVAGGSAQGTVTPPAHTGYEPIATVGWANVNRTEFHVYELRLGSGQVIANVKNTTSASLANCGLTVYVLYRKLGGVVNKLLRSISNLTRKEVVVC